MTNAEPSRLISVRAYLVAGILVLIALFGGIGGWAATTDLSGAVLASGKIVVDSNSKKIQHPTGGVVGQILIRNGDHVRAGDLLMRLDGTVTGANLQLILGQIDELVGRKARLVAELNDAKAVSFPSELTARRQEANVGQILSGEETLFQKRTSTRQSKVDQLGERIASIKEEIAGATAQVASKAKEIELIARELSSLEALEAKRLVTTSKMMALRREAARLEGERAQLTGSIGQAKGRIAETQLQRLNIEGEAKSEVVRELRETEAKIAELAERRTAADDQLRRIDLRSPVDGTVHELSAFTIGGVINASEPVMLIVPNGDKLVVEAQIAPQDIEQARSDDTAALRFPAFNQRTTPTVKGKVVHVAADATHDKEAGLTYFLARVEIADSELGKLGDVKLVPGMPVEVQIRTQARTALSYLVKPILDQFSRAFKER